MFNIILGVVFLIAAITLGVWLNHDGERQAGQTAALRSQGQEASAEITRLWHQGKSSTPMVAYAFTANGIRIRGDAAVPQSVWPALRKAGFLPVRFLPSNPTVNHPAGWERPALPAWFPFLIPGVWAIGSGILLFSVRRQGQVAAEGLPAAGVVSRCTRIKGGWSVRYQFRAKDGVIAKGRDRVWSRLEPGAAICVLYLPENPRRNYVYPLSLYRVAE
jgi:hypothetical protein